MLTLRLANFRNRLKTSRGGCMNLPCLIQMKRWSVLVGRPVSALKRSNSSRAKVRSDPTRTFGRSDRADCSPFSLAVLLCEKRKSERHRLCDNEGVPLICPTCQVLAQSVPTGDRLLLCMGLFSIFLVGSLSQARPVKVAEHGLLALADLVPGPPDSKSTSSRATNPNHP